MYISSDMSLNISMAAELKDSCVQEEEKRRQLQGNKVVL